MLDTHNYCVRSMLESDLEQVLAWRNHPEIRRYMYTQHEITLIEHTNWYENNRNNSDRHMLVFELDNLPVGFVNINKLAGFDIADWGFYVAPGSERGTGKKLGVAVLNYAFDTLKLHKVCGQALAYNTPSINFHTSLGFVQEGVLRDQYFNGQRYYDVVHFGLLADEWKIKEKVL